MTYRRRYFEGEVTTPLIVPGAVTEEKIADEAVTSRKIKDETIQSVDIGAGQVKTADIADGAVTLSKLGADVSIVPLEDGSVTTSKLADGAVTAPKIGDREVTSDKIRESAVSSLKLADGAVTPDKIAGYAVTTPKLVNSGVTETKLATDAVTTPKIKDAAVTTPKIKDAAVTLEKLDPSIPLGGKGKFESALFHVQDRKEYGVQGGDFVAGLPRTRDLNTVVTNEIAGASLNNNQITLPAGKYYIEASAPAFMVDGHKAALFDPINLVYRVEGTSECSCYQGTYAQTRSFVSGRFELIATGVLELVHQGQQTEMADGFGVPASVFGNEVYTDLKIWKID